MLHMVRVMRGWSQLVRPVEFSLEPVAKLLFSRQRYQRKERKSIKQEAANSLSFLPLATNVFCNRF